jgi:hypothetical protein
MSTPIARTKPYLPFIPAPASYVFAGSHGLPMRGWGGVIMSAARHADSPDILLWAGMNYAYVPDFCGARLLGCVNYGTYNWAMNNNTFDRVQRVQQERDACAALPTWKECLPEGIEQTWRKSKYRTDNSPQIDVAFLAPILGLAHFVATLFHRKEGARLMISADKVGYTTDHILGTAFDYLSGFTLYGVQSYPDGRNYEQFTRVRHEVGQTYTNYNSSRDVRESRTSITRIEPHQLPKKGTPAKQGEFSVFPTLEFVEGLGFRDNLGLRKNWVSRFPKPLSCGLAPM